MNARTPVAVALALAASATLSACSTPTYGRFVTASEAGRPAGPEAGGGPVPGVGIYRMVPIPEAPRAPVPVPDP